MDSAMKYLLVFLGGGAGSCLRYAIGGLIQSRSTTTFPWGTFWVNITGALVIGVFLEAFLASSTHSNWRILVAVGVLGGYTTFSALAYESLKLLEARSFAQLAGYTIGTNVLGLLACWLGMVIARQMMAM